MDLQTFVSESLQQIIMGVRSAQEYLAQNPTGAKINPRGVTALRQVESGVNEPHDLSTKLPRHDVEFDVAVEVSESSEGKAGGGLKVVALNLGGQKVSAREHSSVSRIRFTVPIIWPDPYTIEKSGEG